MSYWSSSARDAMSIDHAISVLRGKGLGLDKTVLLSNISRVIILPVVLPADGCLRLVRHALSDFRVLSGVVSTMTKSTMMN